MSRLWRSLPASGIAAVAVYFTMVACGGDDDHNAELQVVGGIANQNNEALTVHIDGPNDDESKPMAVGDQTNSDNWTKFDVTLEEGNVVTIQVLNGGEVLVSGDCTVTNAADLGYARAFAFYFAPPNNYINCAEGFAPNQ